MERIVVVVLVFLVGMVSYRQLGSALERNMAGQSSALASHVSVRAELGSSAQAMGVHTLAVVADLANLRRIVGLAQEVPRTLRDALPAVAAKINDLENVRFKQLEPYRELLIAAREHGDVAKTLANPSREKLVSLAERLAGGSFGSADEVYAELLKFVTKPRREIDRFIDQSPFAPDEIQHIFYDNQIGPGKAVLEKLRDYRFQLAEFETYLSDAKPFEYVERPRLYDINTASADELTLLPGIDQVIAKRIIEARGSKPIESLEDLRAVRGLGKKRAQALEVFFDQLGDLERALDSGTVRDASRYLAEVERAFYGFDSARKFDRDADFGLDGLRALVEQTKRDAEAISAGTYPDRKFYVRNGEDMRDFTRQIILPQNSGPTTLQRIVGSPDRIAEPTEMAMRNLMRTSFGEQGANTLPLERLLAQRLQSQVFGDPPPNVDSSARRRLPREFGSDYWQARGVPF